MQNADDMEFLLIKLFAQLFFQEQLLNTTLSCTQQDFFFFIINTNADFTSDPIIVAVKKECSEHTRLSKGCRRNIYHLLFNTTNDLVHLN